MFRYEHEVFRVVPASANVPAGDQSTSEEQRQLSLRLSGTSEGLGIERGSWIEIFPDGGRNDLLFGDALPERRFNHFIGRSGEKDEISHEEGVVIAGFDPHNFANLIGTAVLNSIP